MLSDLKGEKVNHLFGLLFYNIRNLHRIYESRLDMVYKYGRTFKLEPGIFFYGGGIGITTPENVEYILSTNFHNYIKPPRINEVFRELLGEGIFSSNHKHVDQHGKGSDGQKWYIQRKIAAKVFSANRFRQFSRQVFVRHGNAFINQLETHADQKDTIVDLQQFIMSYTLDSIFNIGFGCDIPSQYDKAQFHHAFDRATTISIMRLLKPHQKLFSWCMPSEYELKNHIKTLDTVIRAVITEREVDSALKEKNDILSLFLQYSQTDGLDNKDTYTFLRDVCMAMLLAGRDTTASALTYTFFQIGRHRDVLNKVLEEIDSKIGQETPSYDSIKQLSYLDAVFHEALRLNPPVAVDPKYCVKDDVLPDGTKVPAGVIVEYWPYVMGRLDDIWENAMAFRPERWLEMDKKPSAYTYPVFQAGPRICIGQSMAILEAKTLLCMFFQKYTIELMSTDEPQYSFNAVTQMKHGLPVRINKR